MLYVLPTLFQHIDHHLNLIFMKNERNAGRKPISPKGAKCQISVHLRPEVYANPDFIRVAKKSAFIEQLIMDHFNNQPELEFDSQLIVNTNKFKV